MTAEEVYAILKKQIQSGGGVISENKLTVNNHIISLETGGSSA